MKRCYGWYTGHIELITATGELFGVLWYITKQGYSEYTINFVRKALKVLEDGCGLHDPEIVNALIVEIDTADSYKSNLCYVYEHSKVQ